MSVLPLSVYIIFLHFVPLLPLSLIVFYCLLFFLPMVALWLPFKGVAQAPCLARLSPALGLCAIMCRKFFWTRWITNYYTYQLSYVTCTIFYAYFLQLKLLDLHEDNEIHMSWSSIRVKVSEMFFLLNERLTLNKNKITTQVSRLHLNNRG